jgi:hypothetical protein
MFRALFRRVRPVLATQQTRRSQSGVGMMGPPVNEFVPSPMPPPAPPSGEVGPPLPTGVTGNSADGSGSGSGSGGHTSLFVEPWNDHSHDTNYTPTGKLH